MSTVRANTYLDASGGSNAQLFGVASPPNSMGFRNRIINGDMRIDQRNAGASVSVGGTDVYTLDRFFARLASGSGHTVQQVTTAPDGFSNSLRVTVGTGAAPTSGQTNWVVQAIEGFNTADFGFGTSAASSITLSFWVRSSLTGTFGGAFENSNETRAYPFTYTISAANTWERKTITLAGDTSGTWQTTNSTGLFVIFSLGAGSSLLGTPGAWVGAARRGATGETQVVATSGATFFITGVQLEAGTVASAFDRRDYGRELMMCQRYYEETGTGDSSVLGIGYSTGAGTSFATYLWQFKVTKRISGATVAVVGSWGTLNSGQPLPAGVSQQQAYLYGTAPAVGTSYFYNNVAGNKLTISAEL